MGKNEAVQHYGLARVYTLFSMGKHNYGWTTLNAIPATHLAPDELMEGGRSCGGFHNTGMKTSPLLPNPHG